MMSVNGLRIQNSPKLSFGRALTDAETKLLGSSIEKGRKDAGIKTLAIGLPIAVAPAEDGKNSGIGNFSDVVDFMKKTKSLMGLTATLFLPFGTPYDDHHSPFSTGAFGIYEGYFDASKLKNKEYGQLLNPSKNAEDKKVLDAVNNASAKNSERTQYNNIEKVDAVLDRAYENYKNGQGQNLKTEFEQFKKRPEINYWLDTYGKEKDKKDPERYEFKQFLLEKQYGEMEKKLNNDNIDIIVDIPVGADRKLDAKLEKDDPFLNNKELEAYDDAQGKFVGWGITPLNPGKKSAQELAYWKARYHASHGNGVRLDAFHCNMFAADRAGVFPEYQQNPKVLTDQLFYGLKDGKIDPEKSFAEHLPYQEQYDAKVVDDYLKEGSANILGKSIEKLCVAKHGWDKNIGQGGFTKDSFDSYGSHEISGINQEFKGDPEKIKSEFTRLFTRGAHKFFLPFTDIFGIDKTYNVSNEANDTNWTLRLPKNWEEKYQETLQKGTGFDAPEIFARVLKKEGKGNSKEAKLLETFGNILRKKEENVKTQQQANEKYGADYVDPTLADMLKPNRRQTKNTEQVISV